MEIRPARIEDVPAVLPMVAKICAFHQALDPAKYGFLPEPEKMYDRWLRARAVDADSVFLVADSGSRLAGFLVGTVETEIPIYRIRKFGFIHDLWVEPEYRHEGIGRQLSQLAVERFAQMGMPQIRLDTAAKNDAARALFRLIGFRESMIEMLMELESK